MASLTDRQLELLALLTVEDNEARYTGTDRIPDWQCLKKAVTCLGGKWVRGRFTFPAEINAAEVIRDAIESGTLVDPQKDFGFYPTPPELAERVAEEAHLLPRMRVLEPSAGRGALALAARRAEPDCYLTCVEILRSNVEDLRRLGFDAVIEGDFLQLRSGLWDRILMNPPYGKRQLELTHFDHAWSLLAPGGRLVAIMPAGVEFRTDRRSKAFRALIEEHGGTIERLPEGSFKAAGTGVSTVLVVVSKGE